MSQHRRLAALASLGWLALAGAGSAMGAQGELDQVNAPRWDGSLVSISPSNNARQSFTPRFDCLTGIEIALTSAYKGRGTDTVTLTVLDETASQPLGSSSAAIPESFDGYWRFDFSPPLMVKSGQPVTFSVVDTGKTALFWKHAGNDPYQPGRATFTGSRSMGNDFLFRTYGTSAAGEACGAAKPK